MLQVCGLSGVAQTSRAFCFFRSLRTLLSGLGVKKQVVQLMLQRLRNAF